MDEQPVRLAQLLVGLSFVADVGMGLEPGGAARAAVLAARLAADLGLAEPGDVYYTTLLQHIGCTAYAHEAAAMLGGDEISVKAAAVRTDLARPRDVLVLYLPNLAPQAGLLAVYEQVDGKGGPRRLRGDAIPLAARVAQVAVNASLFDRLGGRELAVETLERRAGRTLDAELSAAFCARAGDYLGELAAADVTAAAIAAEPAPTVAVAGEEVDAVCSAFGDVVDLKSPYLHDHSAGVSALASSAAEWLRMDAGEVVHLRRAGFLHDLGRAAVPNGIWEKPGSLTSPEWECVRLHPYHSERILKGCPPLAAVAALAGAHHERLDGSGYHRESTSAALPMPAPASLRPPTRSRR